MKKILCMCMAILMVCALFTACGSNTEKPADTSVNQGAPTGKIAVNFGGSVEKVEDGKVTLSGGQVIILNEETVFTDVNGEVENPEIVKGDFIQGYTADDPEDAEITAQRIHMVDFD